MGNTCYGSFEELDLFAAERREIEEQSCKVTAGTGQALNPPTGDGIVFQVNSDDRDGGRGPHCSHERILRCCENDIALEDRQALWRDWEAGRASLQKFGSRSAHSDRRCTRRRVAPE